MTDEEFERRRALRIAAEQAAEAAPPPTSAELPGVISDLLGPDPVCHNAAEIRIKKSLRQAEPYLLAALDDPRATWAWDEAQFVSTCPAGRIVTLLAGIPSRQLGDRIGHLADHPDWRVADPAIKARAALGRADQLPFVVGRLEDKSTPAEEGVDLAVERGWTEPPFLDGVRGWAERTTRDPTRPFSYWAVGFYVRHGGRAAIDAIRGPEMVSPSNDRNIHAVLEQLNRSGERLPPEVVRPLIETALSRTAVWPWNCTFEPALRALAASDPDAAVRTAETYLDLPDHPFHNVAVEFVREASGLPVLYDLEPPEQMELTAAERAVVNLLRDCAPLYGEVCNGGLSQYFFNTAGGSWRRHVAVLSAIGFEAGAAALEEASCTIHPDGAGVDRNVRIEQYAALSERREKRLDELSRLFWTDAPRLKFMLRYKELFARLRTVREQEKADG